MSYRLFEPGVVVATRAVLNAAEDASDKLLSYLARHLAGDWGELDDFDRQQNEDALKSGCRILSAYALLNGERIWIITEADRSSTCILLPSDY